MAQTTTKLQKELLQIIIEELKRLKCMPNINTDVNVIYRDIDLLIKGLTHGSIEPTLDSVKADNLGDILYQIITLIRNIER